MQSLTTVFFILLLAAPVALLAAPVATHDAACPCAPIPSIPLTAGMRAATWSNVGPFEDPNYQVNALAIDNWNHVYVAGQFTEVAGTSANYIARWDGSTWAFLGTGMNDWVFSLAVDTSGTLYAGGRFTEVDGIAANRVARWNGQTWEPLGTGMNNPVLAMVVGSDNVLYAGGSFRLTDDASGYGIARWNGTSWSYLGPGPDNAIYALAADTANGFVYAGGSFTSVNGVAASRVARWDGTQWTALGDGLNEIVYALALDSSNTLYAGGAFTTSGTQPVPYVARWDGTTWNALGNGMNELVTALEVDGENRLYAGGEFTEADGTSASRIAQWDGTSWSALGEGMANGRVTALAVTYSEDHNADLYAGGTFVGAGDDTGIRYLARWGGIAGLPTDVEEHDTTIPSTFTLSPAFPNPFNPRTTFTLTLTETQHVTVRLYDALGRDAGLIYDGMLSAGPPHQMVIEAGHLPSGLYFYQAAGRSFRGTQKVALVK